MRISTQMSTVYLLAFHVNESGRAGMNSKCMDQHCGNVKHRHLQMERFLLTVNLFHYYYYYYYYYHHNYYYYIKRK